jgi:hypothetical protein
MCVTRLLSLLVLLVFVAEDTEAGILEAFETPFNNEEPVCQRAIFCSGESPAYPFVPSSARIAENPVASSLKVAIFFPPLAMT